MVRYSNIENNTNEKAMSNNERYGLNCAFKYLN